MDKDKIAAPETAQQPETKAELAVRTAAEAMKTLSPESRGYFQGFLMGLQAAEERKAG